MSDKPFVTYQTFNRVGGKEFVIAEFTVSLEDITEAQADRLSCILEQGVWDIVEGFYKTLPERAQ